MNERTQVDAAYERLRQHALRPGTVGGIDGWVVLARRGVATWLDVVHSADPDRNGVSADASRPGLATRSVPTCDDALFDVFVAMLQPHWQATET